MFLQCTTHHDVQIGPKGSESLLTNANQHAPTLRRHLPPLLALVIGVELLDILDIFRATQENGTSAVDGSGDDIENTLRTGGSNTSGLGISSSSPKFDDKLTCSVRKAIGKAS
jgi:hypothetical protein